MKKLTWALLSLMLFLGLGVAFAEDETGGEDPAPVISLPTPTFSPANKAAVPPGAKINITLPASIEDITDYLAFTVMYVENDETTVLFAKDAKELAAASAEDMGYGSYADETSGTRLWKTATLDTDEEAESFGMWMSNVRVSENATGTVKLRMRLAAVTYADANTIQYSDEFSAEYTIDPDAVIIPTAPIFKLETGTENGEESLVLFIKNGYTDKIHLIAYKVNGTDADFPDGKTVYDATEKPNESGMYVYDEPLEYTAGDVVKAVTLEFDMKTEEYTMSDISSFLSQPTFDLEEGPVSYESMVTVTAPTGAKVIVTSNGKDPVLTSTNFASATNTATVKINYRKEIKALAFTGATFAEAVQSDIASAEYYPTLSETAFMPETDAAIRQSTKIKASVPDELDGDPDNDIDPSEYFLIYATGEGDELTTTGEYLQKVSDAVWEARANGETPEYPGDLADLDYKIAYAATGVLDYKWYFPAEAPSADGAFTIRGRVVGLDGQNEPVYGPMMTATYTVEGEAIDDALPTFSVESGEVEAGTEVILKPGEGGDVVFYVIDGDEDDLTVEGFDNFKCFMYMYVDVAENTFAKPIKIYEGQTIKAVSAAMEMDNESQGYTYTVTSRVASVTYTVKGGDQPGNKPTLTLDPSVIRLGDGEKTIEFNYTVDPKNYKDAIGFAIRGKMGANASLAKLEYRLKETDEWIDFGDQISALNAGYDAVIPAIPTEGADDQFAFEGTSPKTVYYRMTLEAVEDKGGDFGGFDGPGFPELLVAAEDGTEEAGEGEEDEGVIIAPVIAFELGYNDDKSYEEWPYNAYTPLARTPLEIQVVPAAPTFEPVSGSKVDFGSELTLTCTTQGTVWILYTTDGSEPSLDNDNTGFYSDDNKPKITSTTIKAVAMLDGVYSDVITATYEFNPITASLSLSPMKEDTVGINVGTGVEFSIDGWEEYQGVAVYYTTDGTTVPSKAAFKAQGENGAIKELTVKTREYEGWDGEMYTEVIKTDGHALAIIFKEATHLKAIGYITVLGQEVTTSLLDTTLQIKAGVKPAFTLADGTAVKAGDSLVIKNPVVLPEEPEFPDDYFDNEESAKAYDEAYAAYEKARKTAPKIYYSFDGTEPTSAAYSRQPDVNKPEDAAQWSVFKVDEGQNVTISFKEDEKGLFAHVSYITGSFPSVADTIRFKDGKFAVQAMTVTTESEEGDEVGGSMPGWPTPHPAGKAAFMYGSDFASATYTVKSEPVTPVALTFNPASGSEVEENTAVTITANREVEIFYMMFESEAAAKAAVWDQEKALSYSDELKPVPTKEKNTIKAAYALEGAEAVAETFFYATYKVKELPAIALTFNPADGSEVEDNTTVTVTANREVEIYYIVYADEAAADADTTFTRNAKEVKEDGMPVIKKGATYLRCGVTDRGTMKYFNATYKIKEVANEELELAGVTVYPNPSNGLFNIELPVAATVEVFMSNGVLYQRMKLGEGNATLNIERSGLYFLRITGEGRTTVKRVIVR